MFIIKGYKLANKSLNTLNDAITEMKEAIGKCAQKQYNCLLSQEIEILVDDNVLGVAKVEGNIFDAAVEKLNKRIAISMAKSLDTEYNLSAGANIFWRDGTVYIELCTKNLSYVDALDECQKIKPFHVEQVSDEFGMHPDDAAKYKVWKSIMDDYHEDTVMNVRLYPCKKLEKPNFKDLSFCSKEERAEKIARYRISNILLSNYACGEQIEPSKLMEYMDNVLMRLTEAPTIAQMDIEKNNLLSLLPEITEKIIFQNTELNNIANDCE